MAINSEDSIIQGFPIHLDLRYNPTLTTCAHQEDTSQRQFPVCSLHPQGLCVGAGVGVGASPARDLGLHHQLKPSRLQFCQVVKSVTV